MKILRAYKTQLNPNNRQITKMKMNCGAARFGFNYALSKKKELFDKKEKILNNIELHRQLNKIKGTDECCGHKKDKLGLDERIYSCSNCGMNMDRDLNAAKNLEQLYTGSNICSQYSILGVNISE